MSNRTVVFPEQGAVTLEERDRPDPAADEVLIETETSLVNAGMELAILAGESPEGSTGTNSGEFPYVPGFANVGTVREAGPEAEVAPGTRVASWTPHAAWVTATADDCVPVPRGLSYDEGALFAIAQVVMNGVRRGRVDWGETVVVFGLGVLGQLTVRLCHLAGAETVVGVDLLESRLDHLPDATGVVGVNASQRDPADALITATGHPADVAFEVTGDPALIPSEFDAIREQGRLVVLSRPTGETTIDFHDAVSAPSHEIIGANQRSHPTVATPANPWTKERHASLYFSYVQQSRLAVSDLFTHVVDAANAPTIYADLLADRSDSMAVRLEW